MKRKSAQAVRVEQLQRKAIRRGAGARLAGMGVNELAASLQRRRDGFLSSPEWKQLSQKVLGRYGAKCMKCGFVPPKRAWINVDHIKPRKFFPELSLCEDNLQVLCGKCNKAKGNLIADYRGVTA